MNLRDVVIGIAIGFGIALALALVIVAVAVWRGRLREFLSFLTTVLWRAVLPALVLAGSAGALVLAVALARKDGDHAQWWAEGIGGGFLLAVTLLLYATGSKQYTARAQFAIGNTKTIAAGQEISEADCQKLKPGDRDAVKTLYKATRDFELTATETKTIPKGTELDPEELGRLPETERGKFERRYTAKARVTWDAAAGKKESANRGTVLTDEIYGKLDDTKKRNVRTSWKATTDVTFSHPRTIKNGEIIDDADLVAFPDVVKANASTIRRTTREIVVAEADGKVIADGERVLPEDYGQLSTEQKRAVTSQRGLYFRALVVGSDGRWSTSKLQALLWTYAVLFGLASLFVFAELLHHDLTLPGGDKTFGDMELQEQYLLLLGGPFAAAVIAKASTASKVAGGALAKAPDEGAGTINGLREVISNDAGDTDLVDFQFFFFNLVALAVFAAAFIPDLEEGFPVLPWFLVGLTSTSALAYTTKKTLESAQPQISSIVPDRARPGEQVRIQGRFLITPPAHKPQVTLAGREIPPDSIVFAPEEVRADLQTIAFTIPADASEDEQRLVVIPKGSAVRLEAKLHVLGPVITAVQPNTIMLRPGEEVRIFGENFGSKPDRPDAVTLGALSLVVETWLERQITARLPEDVSPAGNLSTETLRVSDAQGRHAATQVALQRPETTIDEVVPSTIHLAQVREISILGKGFGDHAGRAFLGDWPLVDVDWRNELVRGRFEAPNPDDYVQEKTENVRVLPTNGPPAAKAVTIRK